jgi:ubiquinone/menaquinone biosynthesis C-methylase UbiE
VTTLENEEPELLDRPGLPFSEARESLIDLGAVNRWSLSALPLCRTILPRLGRWREPRLALDLGTGTGEVAATLARAAARRGGPLRIVGLDAKLRHLVVGRQLGTDQLRVVADARALPFRDGAFAWSFSTLFFHHFDAGTNRQIAAEMRRVSTAGAAIVDIRRNRLAPVLLEILFFVLRIGYVTRHDGRVSFGRSWKMKDIRRLFADQPVSELKRRFPFRFSVVLEGTRGSTSPR